MVVNYNDNGELTMGGTSLKTIAQSFWYTLDCLR